jgi:hypothetical protein
MEQWKVQEDSQRRGNTQKFDFEVRVDGKMEA